MLSIVFAKTLVRLLTLVLFILSNAAYSEIERNYPKLVSSIDKLTQRHLQMQTQALGRQQALNILSVSNVTLSPDGQWLAFLRKDQSSGRNANGRISSLMLMNLKNGEQSVVFTSPKINQFVWSQDAKHLFIISPKFVSLVSLIPDNQHVKNKASNKNLHLQTHKNSLAIHSRARIIYKLDSKHDEYVLGIHKQAPHALLVASRHPKSKIHTIYMLDSSGETHAIYTSQHELLALMSASNDPLEVIFVKRVKNGRVELVDLRRPKKPVIAKCELRDPCAMIGLKESQNNEQQALVVFARLGHDLVGLYNIDINSIDINSIDTGIQEYAVSRMHQDPGEFFDASDISLKFGQPNTISYQTKSIQHYGLNSNATKALTEIEQLLTQKNLDHPFALVDTFYSIQTNTNSTLWLIKQESPQNASVRYFVYDTTHTQSNKRLQALESISYLSDRMASYRSTVDYIVSDGMLQFAHITVPNGYDLQTLPLIVMPHGGPWSRTDNHYSFVADFLASRGYIVYEPNFRSSTGMGFQYMVSANKDFGDGIVQQDIIDGMNALLSAGIGDAKRLAVVGHSFGGFSALAALSFTPELFTMAFAGAPPTDLTYSIEFLDRKDFRNLSDRRQQMFSQLAVDISDEKDKQRLSAQSPFMHWQNVKKPLYVWAGKFDDRVDIKKVKQYMAKLRSSQTSQQEHYFFVDPYAGHSPSRHLSMEAYLYLIEWSLNQHFDSHFDSSVSVFLEDFLQAYQQ